MAGNNASKTNRMVGMAIFIAIIIVLQLIGGFIKFGSFSISLVLIPIVVGAALYGPIAGGIFGGVFGLVVLIGCVSGTDVGGHILWMESPVLTSVLCLLKGILAGYTAGLVYSALGKKNTYLGVICAAIVCPVVNTGIFIGAMMLLFRDTLTQWAGNTSVIYFAFIGMAGINFLLELAVNIVLSPAIVRILGARRKVS